MPGKSPTLAFTGGGTGGHIYPGLAVAARLRELGFDGRLAWLGSGKESDRAAVEAAGIEYRALPSGKLRRSLSLENLADAFRVMAGYAAALSALKELRPALLFSKGGYVSVPPCAAAARLGIPYLTHESDLTPGLATRLNARRAERILVSYEETRARFPEEQRGRVLVVGNPIRSSVRSGDAARGRAILGAPAGLPVVLFLGGSQGARQVNELALAVLPRLAEAAFVAHQTGPAGEGLGGGPGDIPGRYRAYGYITDELPDILAAADLVVGRAGAGTLWECGALGKPMILVPLCGSGTRGDQVDNALLFKSRGAAAALVGPEAEPGKLYDAIRDFIDHPERSAAAGAAARAIAGADAADATARIILERLGGKA